MLSEGEFWACTPRELWALREVWDAQNERDRYNLAQIQATLYNAHFKTDGVPWTAEDLLGKTDRMERLREDRAAKFKATQVNRKLSAMKPGQTEGVPEWALQIERNRKKWIQ